MISADISNCCFSYVKMTVQFAINIFDKFYKGDSSRSGEGNVLGLALCSKVIMPVGGGITVESALGRGSALTVTLPR